MPLGDDIRDIYTINAKPFIKVYNLDIILFEE